MIDISKDLVPVVALSVLASCQTVPASKELTTAEHVYIAKGNEPGWILKMDGKTLNYEGDYGDTKIIIPAPAPRSSFNGMRHVADRLTVDVTYSACTDDMSGKRFADTVTVIADGKQVSGCGGRALPPESLDGTTWVIVMMDQLPVLEAVRTEIAFAGGRVSGTAGCNRLSGAYDIAGNIFTFGEITATRMMCPEKQMAQEMQFLKLLTGKVSKRYTVDGNLILANDSGNRVTLRQVL